MRGSRIKRKTVSSSAVYNHGKVVYDFYGKRLTHICAALSAPDAAYFDSGFPLFKRIKNPVFDSADRFVGNFGFDLGIGKRFTVKSYSRNKIQFGEHSYRYGFFFGQSFKSHYGQHIAGGYRNFAFRFIIGVSGGNYRSTYTC